MWQLTPYSGLIVARSKIGSYIFRTFYNDDLMHGNLY